MSAPLQDAKARAAAESELETSLRIEAGAGTGKTTALVRRVIAHVKRGTTLAQIVAITFTEKAAGELRIRLRRKLEEEVPLATEAEVARRLRTALVDLDGAPISTIHGFCQALLRERPVEAGLDPGFEIEEGAATAARFEDVFARFLAQAGDVEPTVDPKPLRAALERGVGLDKIRDIAWFLTRHADLAEVPGAIAAAPPPPPAHDVLRRALDLAAQLRDAWVAVPQSDTLVVALTPVVDALFALGAEDLGEESLARALSRGPAIPKAGTKGNQKNWNGKGPITAARALVLALADELATYRASAGAVVATALAHCLLEIPRRLEREKHAAGVIDFDDMLRKTRDLLRDRKDVRRRFQERFATLMLDEFQDTDPLQAEIAFFLAEDPAGPLADRWDEVRIGPGRLFLVGDPKQSIYRFRRADLDVYARAGELLEKGGGRTEPITVNFRSAQVVLDWVNARFASLFAPQAVGAVFQPSYEDLRPGPNATDAHARVVVLGRKADAALAQNAEESRIEEAGAIADFLQRVANGEPSAWMVQVRDGDKTREERASFKHCAILFRSTTQVHLYEHALRARGIPFRVSGGRNFYQRAEVKCAVVLFRAVDEPSDTIAIAALLRSPVFAVSDADLAAWVARGGVFDPTAPPVAGGPESIRVALALVRDLHARRHAAALATFVEDCFAATRMLEVFHLKPGGEARVANLSRFLDIARRLESQGKRTFRAFVREVRQLEADSGQEEESGLLADESGAVSVLTIHKAKGLEFPIVVLADLGRSERRETEPFVDRDEHGAPRLHFCVGGAQARILETPGHAAALVREELRARAEEHRLVYVAATRAQGVLVLPRLFDERAERRLASGDAPQDAFTGDTTFHEHDAATRAKTWIEVDAAASGAGIEPAFRLALDPATLVGKLPAAAQDVLRERREYHARARATWARPEHARNVTSASARKNVVDHRVVVEAEPTTATAARAKSFGVLAHAVFERIDWAKPDVDALASFVRMRAEADGLEASDADAALELVRKFLSTPLATRLRGAKRVVPEMPFVHRAADGTLIEGAMDLVAEEADGRLLLVDWKTDDVKGAALDQRAASYAPQMRMYADALRAATGREVADAVLVFVRSGDVSSLD